MSDLLPHTTGGGGGYVPARSADPLTGSVLDKYEVLHKLGEGGMATVYRGRHTTLGRDVAIKVLHPHLSRLERNRARFAREARAIEHLDHDNILKIFDYSGSEVDESYIVTEFVDGATLQQLNAERGRVPSEVVSVSRTATLATTLTVSAVSPSWRATSWRRVWVRASEIPFSTEVRNPAALTVSS